MVKKQFKILSFIKKHWLMFFIGATYLLLTLPALLDSNHIFCNLEPYPDGLLYALSGRNLIMGKGLGLVNAYSFIDHWVPPLYSLVLAGGYLLFGPAVSSFYLTNVLMQLAGLIFLYLILNKTTRHWQVKLLGLVVYLSHIVLFWLPSLPMGENLIIPLLLMMIYALLEKNGYWRYGLLAIATGGLFFTRYATIGVVGVGLLIALISVYPKLNHKLKGLFVASLIALPFAFELLLRARGIHSFGIIKAILAGNNTYFSLKFIWPNIIAYSEMLLLGKGWYLWQPVGISTAILTGLFFYAIYYFYRAKCFVKANILLFLFLAQLPIQLVFYLADARYLVLTIPLITLGVAWLLDEQLKKQPWWLWLAIGGVVLQLFTQQQLIREVIGNNLLGRSTAWQYEAIQHFNDVVPEDGVIITSLPPYLIDTYQTADYRYLPLSNHQEFLQKKQHLWGEDIDYRNLIGNYNKWLEEGRELYISNAYITHQQSVIEDYEAYKDSFNFELVNEGCLNACNIYRLSLP